MERGMPILISKISTPLAIKRHPRRKTARNPSMASPEVIHGGYPILPSCEYQFIIVLDLDIDRMIPIQAIAKYG